MNKAVKIPALLDLLFHQRGTNSEGNKLQQAYSENGKVLETMKMHKMIDEDLGRIF